MGLIDCKEFELELNDGKPIEGYYIYGWVNADWGGVYFYIGKGYGNRYKDIKKRGHAFNAILREWRCFPVILEDCLTEEEAEQREVDIKQWMIFEKGFPIMDGEGHSNSLKHLATQYAKRKLRESDTDWREGRKKMAVHPDFPKYKRMVVDDEITAVAACKELGVSRSTWYKWMREVAV